MADVSCADNHIPHMHAHSGVVYDVIDRRTETRDPAIANVDQMLLVMSLSLPPFDAQQATRFLVSSEAAEIPVTLLLNKADLMEEADTAAVIEQVRVAGSDYVTFLHIVCVMVCLFAALHCHKSMPGSMSSLHYRHSVLSQNQVLARYVQI